MEYTDIILKGDGEPASASQGNPAVVGEAEVQAAARAALLRASDPAALSRKDVRLQGHRGR